MQEKPKRQRSRKGQGPWIDVGEKLRALRIARHGMSQHDLARLATSLSGENVSYSLISNVERGQQEPSIGYLRKIAPALQVSLESLLQLTGWMDGEGRLLIKGAPALSGAGTVTPPDIRTLPRDPLMALAQALERGPWPESITFGIYALLAAYADNRRDYWRRKFDETAAEILQAQTAADPLDYEINIAWNTPEAQRPDDPHRTTLPPEWSLLRERLFGTPDADGPAPTGNGQ